jgi:hypothetical protein
VWLAVVFLAPGGVPAQENAGRDTTMSAVPLPGGFVEVRTVLQETGVPDPSTLVLDLIRRSFETPAGTKGGRRDQALRPLVDLFNRNRGGFRPSTDLVPLPLTPAIWTTAILSDRPSSGSVLLDLLTSPAASMIYCGLLALDPPTRAWFAANPALLTGMTGHQAAAFFLAAPGLRVGNGVVQVPGGGTAVPGWQALVGRPVTEPIEFVRALLTANAGRLAYMYGASAQLTPGQRRVLLSLDSSDPTVHIATVRRMLVLFERVAAGWDIDERPFWRPALDPALLVSDLATDPEGTPAVPGTMAFWTVVFGDDGPSRDRGEVADGPPADFTWLCEQIFTGGQAVVRGPYQQVLFASRRVGRLTRDTWRDAVVATRAAVQFPALIGALERARITSISGYAGAARRAAAISEIGDKRRAVVALTQFQGALSIAVRALARGGIDEPRAAELIAGLAAIDLDDRGDYGGRIVEWLTAAAPAGRDPGDGAPTNGGAETAGHGLDDRVLALLAGTRAPRGETVEWEGTRYRVDPAGAETGRLRSLLGDAVPPYLATAESLVAAAVALEDKGLTRAALTTHGEAVEAAIGAISGDGDVRHRIRDLDARGREAMTAVARAARSGDTKSAARLAPPLRLLADVLAARGLMELAYAAALGQAENAAIPAGDAASRHDFGFDMPGFGRPGAWRRPAAGADRARDWHVTGALLGLDVVLAPLALTRVSTRPPATRPTLNDEDRRVMTETVVLMEAPRLSAADHRTVLAAIRRGRARLAAVRSDRDVEAIADALSLPAARRTLLAWTVAQSAAPARLSPYELLVLGLETDPSHARLDAWGASGEPRIGCLCLQLPGRQADLMTGRWHTGALATGFPDLNLRLAEVLGDLRMPATLLPSVLAAATWDFVLNVRSRDFDDRQGLIDFVDALTSDRVEQYLALLTTDGPLVPLSAGSAPQ